MKNVWKLLMIFRVRLVLHDAFEGRRTLNFIHPKKKRKRRKTFSLTHFRFFLSALFTWHDENSSDGRSRWRQWSARWTIMAVNFRNFPTIIIRWLTAVKTQRRQRGQRSDEDERRNVTGLKVDVDERLYQQEIWGQWRGEKISVVQNSITLLSPIDNKLKTDFPFLWTSSKESLLYWILQIALDEFSCSDFFLRQRVNCCLCEKVNLFINSIQFGVKAHQDSSSSSRYWKKEN